MKRLLLALLLLTVSGCVTEMRTSHATRQLCLAEEADWVKAHDGHTVWVDKTDPKNWVLHTDDMVYLRCVDRYPKEAQTFYASGSGGGGLTFVYPLGPAFR